MALYKITRALYSTQWRTTDSGRDDFVANDSGWSKANETKHTAVFDDFCYTASLVGGKTTYRSGRYESQVGLLFPIYGKIWKNHPNVPNHQPVLVGDFDSEKTILVVEEMTKSNPREIPFFGLPHLHFKDLVVTNLPRHNGRNIFFLSEEKTIVPCPIHYQDLPSR